MLKPETIIYENHFFNLFLGHADDKQRCLLWKQTMSYLLPADRRWHNTPLSPHHTLFDWLSADASRTPSVKQSNMSLFLTALIESIKCIRLLYRMLCWVYSLQRFLSFIYLLLELFMAGLVCMVTLSLCVLISFAGCGLTRLGCYGTLFSVFLLDHNEDQPENQRERQL